MIKTLLSAKSHFSILRGIHSPEEICKSAHLLGYESVALTDLNNLYGLPEFIRSCNDFGVSPVIGTQIGESNESAIVYATTQRGFASLCAIITEKQCNPNFSLAAALKKNSSDIYVLTRNESLLFLLWGHNAVYYHMKRPVVPPLAIRKNKIPCCIAPDAVFIDRDDYEIHKVLRAIDNNTTLSQLEQAELYDPKATVESWEQICERFEVFDYALAETEKFSELVQSKIQFGAPVMPRFIYDGDSIELLRKNAYAGAQIRYGEHLEQKVVDRLEYELGLIISKGFADYFLVVDDIVKQSPRTCGRGSGASSIVAYSLGITNVDPIRYNLMFERFLNPGRTDPPDIDIDFAWDERDTVLEYVFGKYGKSHAAMVATHQTCGARMAIREVARIFGLTESEVSVVTKKIPWFVDLPENPENLAAYITQWPSMKGLTFDPPWPQIFTLASRIIGKPRGIGTHCGGVIITPQPITTYVPIQISAKGFPIIQWEKDGAEQMGLVKIDLLGNRSLAVIRDAIINVEKEYGGFDETRWDPQSDRETVQLLADGRTMGVFYVESPAMRLLQRKTGAGDFEHLVIHSSIIRPAANKYIREYVRRLKGGHFRPAHPALLDTLSETYGIMVYQEDVSRVAMALASFSVENADMLRKIMSKRERNRRFDDFHKMFTDGCHKNGINDTVIATVWEMMQSFSGYSFCKPHSASYVQVSFQSAYIKAHFPAAFMAAVLSNYGGFYSTQAYISECMRLGCSVVPPDVNVSTLRYYSKGSSIYVGLCQIKGLSSKGIEKIISERRERGMYGSIQDFLQRTSIDESDTEKLICAGALDQLAPDVNRSQHFWLMRQFYRMLSCSKSPDLTGLSKRQYLMYQYKTLGFLTECHPITLMQKSAQRRIRAIDIPRFIGKTITIPGWCITSKTVSTKRGDSMEFVTFEDETATFETVFFPEIYKKFAAILAWQAPFMVTGKVTQEFGVEIIEVEQVGKM